MKRVTYLGGDDGYSRIQLDDETLLTEGAPLEISDERAKFAAGLEGHKFKIEDVKSPSGGSKTPAAEKPSDETDKVRD